MANYTVLYNPLAGNGAANTEVQKLTELLPEDRVRYFDMTEIKDYPSFFLGLPEGERIVVVGGDGTLNRFINDVGDYPLEKLDVYHYGAGSGNDFMNDLGKKKGEPPFPINQYLRDLPTVTIKGKTYKFLNGVGYGIDGYCCEEGDRQRTLSSKPVNYTSIAIKGLLFKFKPASATVTVDGVTRKYKKVWLAPMMNGRFYGGGMMPTPNQDRLNKERTLSVLVWHDSGKLKTLTAFPGIFKGEHIKQKKCEVFVGKEIIVEFDRPVAAQIDGETVLNVTRCEARSAALRKAEV